MDVIVERPASAPAGDSACGNVNPAPGLTASPWTLSDCSDTASYTSDAIAVSNAARTASTGFSRQAGCGHCNWHGLLERVLRLQDERGSPQNVL